jgi:sphingomyelin phosphodiesterase
MVCLHLCGSAYPCIPCSARDSYGSLVGGLSHTDSLNASFWHKLTETFEANDAAYQLYNARLTRGAKVAACNGPCKATAICDMRALRSENNCVRFTMRLLILA